MAYVSYLHMEKKYRPLIQPSPLNDAIESQNGSISLPSLILQPVQEVLQNPIDATADTKTLLGDEDYPPTPKARPDMSDDTISQKSDKYMRNDPIILTEAPQIPASETVHDSNPDNEQPSTRTVRALIHRSQQHHQSQARQTVADAHTRDEQEQLLPSTLSDSEDQESPPALPRKNY